jgi:NodT family efflux transporter outer membrane factor (OMF) lipoprotein
MIRGHVICFANAVMLASCATSPPPALDPADVPAKFEQSAPANGLLWPAANWWQGFGDRQLDTLIATAQTSNLDIAQATARLNQADARARKAGAALVPSIGLNAGIDTFQGNANGRSQRETDYSVALAASYELDFWGRNRNMLEAAQALRSASAADRATVALTVTSAVAETYFRLLSLRDRIAVAQANLKSAETILAIVQRRVMAGYSAASDLIQQRANVATQRIALPVLEQQELEARNALAILLGRAPEGLIVNGNGLDGLAAPSIMPGLPSELLMRRPDISNAEANLAAAHADLEVARKAFFPSLNLSASGGVAYPAMLAAINTLPGTGLSTGFGASLVQLIFDGGRIAAQSKEAEARERELLAAYRASIIAAFSDVENALGDLSHLATQEQIMRDQAVELEKMLKAAQNKYDAGYADFLVVTDAQRAVYAARDQLSDIRRARLSASVTLYKALGGGWNSEGGEARRGKP